MDGKSKEYLQRRVTGDLIGYSLDRDSPWVKGKKKKPVLLGKECRSWISTT